MRRWTPDEDEVLRQCAAMGAAGVRRALLAELGAKRSVKAVQHRASLVGVSLAEHATCPACGRSVRRLRPSGMCSRCHDEARAGSRSRARRV